MLDVLRRWRSAIARNVHGSDRVQWWSGAAGKEELARRDSPPGRSQCHAIQFA